VTAPIANYIEPFFGSGAVWFNAPFWSTPHLPPFPYFGGKRTVAPIVWRLFGAPAKPPLATVNDANGFVVNAWRAMKADPEAVSEWAFAPVMEANLHAMHVYCLQREASLLERLCADVDYYDARLAGYWMKGLSEWIGGGWCANNGPWWVEPDDEGVMVFRKGAPGEGVNRQLPHLRNVGRGVNRTSGDADWFTAIQAKLRAVRICNGDFERILGPSVTTCHGITGVFLDPPYGGDSERDMRCYGKHDDGDVSSRVRGWCLVNGDNPMLRIVLAGYEGEHNVLTDHGWGVIEWQAHGGYGNNGTGRGLANKHRERLWYSPHCVREESPPLLAMMNL
jgi:DNA adenine methylase